MKLLVTTALAFLSSAAMAYPNSLEMTCAQAKNYMVKNGTATLATGDEFATFTWPACMGGIPAYVRTEDVRYCFVGEYCDGNFVSPPAGYYQGTD